MLNASAAGGRDAAGKEAATGVYYFGAELDQIRLGIECNHLIHLGFLIIIVFLQTEKSYPTRMTVTTTVPQVTNARSFHKAILVERMAMPMVGATMKIVLGGAKPTKSSGAAIEIARVSTPVALHWHTSSIIIMLVWVVLLPSQMCPLLSRVPQ